MADWENYYKIHSTRKPREQVIGAVALCARKDHALDLGAGALVESVFFLKEGFKKVTAVDSSAQAHIFAKHLDPEKFILRTCSYQDFDFKSDTFDLVNAQYALPFNGPENFANLIKNIKLSLKPGGIFVGQFFGVRDGFNNADTKLVFQTKEGALLLLKDLELIEFIETEKEVKTTAGSVKYWHVFHFIARRSDE